MPPCLALLVLAKPPFRGANQSRGCRLRPGLGTPGARGRDGAGGGGGKGLRDSGINAWV